jgi:pyruvate dehydrogenase E2 component (dihydrolipoamide acetyltransferase)
MARAFKLPDLGEGIHEGEIVEILVSVGDRVKEGDPLLEVETDKAVTAIPSPFTGTVGSVPVKAGDTVTVGDVLVVFGDADDGEAMPTPEEDDSESSATGDAATSKTDTAEVFEHRHPSGAPGPDRPPEASGGRRDRPPVPASPATRRLARELGVDLYAVEATGPAGLVTAEDVRRHGEEQPADYGKAVAGPPGDESDMVVSSPDLPDFSKWGPIETVALKSVRRATARQMALSWSQIPHVANQNLVDVTDLDALRRRKSEAVTGAGGKLTLTVFALKAVTAGLRHFPQFNAAIDMKNEVIVYRHYTHIGIAMDTDRGLVVPVIRDVDRKSLTELAVELSDVADRARAGKIDLDALQGGTFTITNAGAVGGGFFSPIINHPQAAILGMGRARLQPAVRMDDGGDPVVVPRLMMPLVVSFDHRIADGADAIRFMQVISDCLEDPEQLLLAMH